MARLSLLNLCAVQSFLLYLSGLKPEKTIVISKPPKDIVIESAYPCRVQDENNVTYIVCSSAKPSPHLPMLVSVVIGGLLLTAYSVNVL